MNEKEELKTVDFELLITIIILGTVFLSVFNGYNTHLKLSNKKPFWNDSEARNIMIISNIIILIAAIITLLLAIKNLEDLKQKKQNLDKAYINVFAALFFVLSAFLLLIGLLRYPQESLMATEEVGL
ncbi:MAG: hypothetical protein WC277_04415 [Bacilli bacterium]